MKIKMGDTCLICSLIFLGIGGMTSLFSINVQSTVTSMIVYITSVICMMIGRKNARENNSIQMMANAFYVNVLVIGIIAIYESLTGNYINPSYDYYLSTYNVLGLYRPKTVFYNTNNLTVFLLLSLPLCMYAAEKWKHSTLLKILILLLSVCGIVLTGSRTGVAGLFIFAALIVYYKIYSLKRTVVSFLGILALCFSAVMLLISVLFGDNHGILLVSQEDRIPIWKAAFQACKNYYFMGAGPGTSAFVKGSLGDPHNYFLEILLEFGAVGLGVFCGILKSTILPSIRMKDTPGLFYLKTFLLLFLICSICPSSMQGYYYVWIIFGILAAQKDLLKEKGGSKFGK